MFKKKLFVLFAAVTIAVGTFATPVQASDNCETGGLPNKYCPYWNVTIVWKFTGPEVTCSTGGEFQCEKKPGSPSGEL
jgi:hypothetical protein